MHYRAHDLPLTGGLRVGPEHGLELCATIMTKLNYGTKLEAGLDGKLIFDPRAPLAFQRDECASAQRPPVQRERGEITAFAAVRCLRCARPAPSPQERWPRWPRRSGQWACRPAPPEVTRAGTWTNSCWRPKALTWVCGGPHSEHRGYMSVPLLMTRGDRQHRPWAQRLARCTQDPGWNCRRCRSPGRPCSPCGWQCAEHPLPTSLQLRPGGPKAWCKVSTQL